MRLGFFALIIFFILGSGARADVSFTILQTSDIHSHFTNHDSVFQLGGLARLATEIREIKSRLDNVLVLDAGDFTEGSIFFTYNTGESTHKIMEAIDYDAIVLGNHDWLIGPQELYKSFENSGFRIPVLSANIDMSDLDPKIELSKYLKPYIIKDIDGVKVGILGLSTFQYIFDQFFVPVKLQNPIQVATKYVEELRKVQGCQVVIVLSHLGFSVDRNLAQNVKGIDLIVGGHSHILLKQPAVENGVPISHVGKWGRYLGQIDLNYSPSGLKMTKFTLHPITPDIPEEPGVRDIVDGTIANIEKRWGPIFHERVLDSSVDLPLIDYTSDNIVGHWIADAYREYTKADTAFENPSYNSRDIYRGVTFMADVFDLFPNIYNPETGKAWTIKTFNISGLYAKYLVSGVFRSDLYLKISNAKIILDLTKTLNQLYSMQINGAPIRNSKIYKVAGTNGVLEAIDFLKTYGIEIPITDVQDTGVEAWRVAADFLKSKSPITPDKIHWEGRVRTIQPDVVIRPEELTTTVVGNHQVKVEFIVRNTGLNPAASTDLTVSRAAEPWDTLGDPNVDDLVSKKSPMKVENLGPGEGRRLAFTWDTSQVKPGRYVVSFNLSVAQGEMETENNILETYIDAP